MTDGTGRTIDYLRLSVTDRCNLRCVYCMPEEGVPQVGHAEVLRYEEMLRLCRLMVGLGITKVRITGGEPLVRRDLPVLVAGLRQIPGIRNIALTTNGVLLAQQLPALAAAGLNGVNLSLDTLDRAEFLSLTRRDELSRVLDGLQAALECHDLTVKVNCLSLKSNRNQWVRLASLARDNPLAVRFIEVMPIGLGRAQAGSPEAEVLAELEQAFGPGTPEEGVCGGGPARYVRFPGFRGPVGFISALSHPFCCGCNRVRLTAGGYLKTCLQYERGMDLRPLLTEPDGVILKAVRFALAEKSVSHAFFQQEVRGGERHTMNEIGG